MALPAAALQLAGFLLAHAFWTVSEMPEGGHYVPQALCMNAAGNRTLTSFDAATPTDEAAKAKAFIGTGSNAYADCAIARQMRVGTPAGDVDALVIDVVQGEGSLVTVVQAYRPAAKGGFRLLGDELMLGDGGPLAPLPAAHAAAALREGASDHPGLGDKWSEWSGARDPVNPLQQR